MGWPSRGSASTWRVGQEMSRPCGQRRALASRRGRQGRTVLPRIRREWTGPNDGAVRVANTHGCAGDRLGDALASGEPGADELAGVALVDRRAGRADGLAAVAAARRTPGRRGGRVRRWRCRSCRCGSGAGSGASRCPRRRAGLPRRGSAARAMGVCRRRSPRVPSPVMGSGPRAAVAAVSAVTATTCLDRGNPGR